VHEPVHEPVPEPECIDRRTPFRAIPIGTAARSSVGQKTRQ
jgi:hypothetical protein